MDVAHWFPECGDDKETGVREEHRLYRGDVTHSHSYIPPPYVGNEGGFNAVHRGIILTARRSISVVQFRHHSPALGIYAQKTKRIYLTYIPLEYLYHKEDIWNRFIETH